jgi:hypothetical protein
MQQFPAEPLLQVYSAVNEATVSWLDETQHVMSF